MTTLGLDRLPGRCEHGFADVHHPAFCNCSERGEWVTFVRALKAAAALSPDGLVHQTHMRPLIAAIPHKHRGLLYRKARRLGLIAEVGREDSTDRAGRNTDKAQRIYELRSAA